MQLSHMLQKPLFQNLEGVDWKRFIKDEIAKYDPNMESNDLNRSRELFE